MSDNNFFIRFGDYTTPLIKFNHQTNLETVEEHAHARFNPGLPNARHIQFYSGKAKKFLVLNDDLLNSDYNPFAINIPADDGIICNVQPYVELFIEDDSDAAPMTNSSCSMYNTFKITTTKFIYHYFVLAMSCNSISGQHDVIPLTIPSGQIQGAGIESMYLLEKIAEIE
jgi:hypothetical protein